MNSIHQWKRCSRCGITKPADEFYLSKSASDGLQGYCKGCGGQHRKKVPAPRPQTERLKGGRKQYTPGDVPLGYRKCGKCESVKLCDEFYHSKTRADGYGTRCKSCIAAQQKASYNKETKRQYMREYKERVGPKSYVLSPEQKARKAARDNERRRSKPAMVRSYAIRRRQREAENNQVGVSPEQWDHLCKAFGNKCLCCGEETYLSPDHVIPVRLGGQDHITNIQPLCKRCNFSKSDRHITDYRDRDILLEFLRSIYK